MLHIHRGVVASLVLSMLMPSHVEAVGTPYEQDFTLTAYYSPLPDQCCYVKGSYEADKVLNGQGTHGADGTAVYPGMLAAPPSYAFGTRIKLPGLGIMTVHDRGGAIQEWDKTHRLDVWAGSGEEGLARALAFGVKHIRGTVYPVGTQMPAESFALETLPAPEDKLKPYVAADAGLLDMQPTFGAHGLSVRMLQDQLKTLGYFDHAVTGMFGEVTKQSLAAFIGDMKLNEPADTLTQKTSAYIAAAVQLKDAPSPVIMASKDSSPADIMKMQRMMRFLGYYRGRTDGEYSTVLFNAILSYQRDQMLVGDATSPGAGRVGPVTKSKLDLEVRRRRVASRAKLILDYIAVRDRLEQRGSLITSTMQKGSNGQSVARLQKFLASQGFFPPEKVNGNYGELTESAVKKYQVARELLKSENEKGAGTIGPVTLKTIRQEQIRAGYMVVRAEGLHAI